MKTYRKINYKIDNQLIYFYNPQGEYYHDTNVYGRGSMVRSIPEGCALTTEAYAKTVIDHLYDRMETSHKEEKRLFYVSRSNRFIKNVLNT